MSRGSKPGERRGGRQTGTPNKITKELREMILSALDKAGGEKYLLTQAMETPASFMTLLGKVLPTQITGKDGGPVQTITATQEQFRTAAREVLGKF